MNKKHNTAMPGKSNLRVVMMLSLCRRVGHLGDDALDAAVRDSNDAVSVREMRLSCVTTITARSFCTATRRTSSITVCPLRASKAAVGSSQTSSRGLCQRRAMATRCCWPPESWRGQCVGPGDRSTASRIWRSRAHRLAPSDSGNQQRHGHVLGRGDAGSRLYC